MHSNNKLIAGNWKMNGTVNMAETLAGAVAAHVGSQQDVDVLLCPSHIHLTAVKAAIGRNNVYLGGQNCHVEPSGAHTGSTSVAMLKDAGAQFVLTGHSERRADARERDELIAAKSNAAISGGLIPVICVGEQETTRDTGEHVSVVLTQIKNSLPDGAKPKQFVLAYEPVWAIGTGKTASLADVEEMHNAIRDLMVSKFGDDGQSVRILYGGSVKPDNALDILSISTVGGVLVGGASLKAEDFNAIITAGIQAAK